jgi:hypothetical protein
MCIKSEKRTYWRGSRFEITYFSVLKVKKTLYLAVIKFTVGEGFGS